VVIFGTKTNLSSNWSNAVIRSLLADPETDCSDLFFTQGKHGRNSICKLDHQSEYLTSQNSNTVVFIDTGVIDYQCLQAGALPGICTIILSPSEDPIAQITAFCQQNPQITTIHIVSHGAPGCLFFGAGQFSLGNICDYEELLKLWPDNAHILLYGCQVAAGDAGEEFIDKLHQLTGATVLASATATGSRRWGGDWELEVMACRIDNKKARHVVLAFTRETLASYKGIFNLSFRFSGTITDINFDTGTPTEFAVGDAISGIYTFDPAQVDNNPRPDYGYYLNYTNVLGTLASGISFRLGGNILVFDAPNYDGYQVEANGGIGTSVQGLSLTSFTLLLVDGTGAIFNSDSLPLEPPNLTNFSDTTLDLSFNSFDPDSPVFDFGEVRATVNSLTIAPAEPPSIFLIASTSIVAEDGTTNLVYTFVRTGDTTNPLSVNFTVGGSAHLNSDYIQAGANSFTATAGTITFVAGTDTAILTIDPTVDAISEGNETVALTLASGTGYTIETTSTVTGTINDDLNVALAASPRSVAEDGITSLTYIFTRTGDTTNALSVNFTAGGTATFNSDYTQTGADSYNDTTGTITFAAGSETATIAIDPTADAISEGDETVALTLASGTGYTIKTTSAVTGTISDGIVSISISNVTISEGNGGTTNAIFTVTLSKAIDTAITLDCATADGTATTADNDYIAIPVTPLTFNAGERSKTITVAVNGDTKIDGNETFFGNESFFVNLSNLQANGRNVTIEDDQGKATINNDDGLHWQLSQTLKDPTPNNGSRFGWRSVAVSGNKLLVGDLRDDLREGAYLFDATTGGLLKQFLDPTPASGDDFGWSVAIDGNYILVGERFDNTFGFSSGAAYLFDATSGSLLQTFYRPPVGYHQQFGFSVAISSNNVLIGALGGAYLFDATTGSLLQSFSDPNPGTGGFGVSVAIDGNNVLVGDYQSAYLFDAPTGNLLTTFINPNPGNAFSSSVHVDIEGNNVLVGAYQSAYLFDATTGSLLQSFSDPNPGTGGFGSSVVIDGNNVLIGGDGEGAYLFDAATGYLLQTFLEPGQYDGFGSSVALDAENVLIGSFTRANLFQLVDAPPQVSPQVSVTAIANGNEANGSPAVFRFSRTGSTTAPLSVSYRLLGTAQAGSDYTGATTGSISFSAGSATAELSLPALADTLIDPGETIIAQIVPSPTATPSYLITPGQQTATATITAEGMVVTVNGPSQTDGSNGEYRNMYAFAALKSDGTVVCWGDTNMGGIVTLPTPSLSGVTQIFSNGFAFAALKGDGTVVCWGDTRYGGTTPAGLGGVTQIF